MTIAPTIAADEPKNTKASQLVDRLRQAILSGEMKPGTKINIDVVRRELDVSLSPLREALARLVAVGLVELPDNRGYSVAPVSLGNLTEITDLRVEFESLALGSAIRNGDLAWESDVMRALHRLNRTVREASNAKTLEDWEHAHRDLHRYRRVFLVAQGGDRNVATEHSEIAQGAVARDATFACSKLREHIQRTGNNLRARLSDTLRP